MLCDGVTRAGCEVFFSAAVGQMITKFVTKLVMWFSSDGTDCDGCVLVCVVYPASGLACAS